jgi:hypothetical protein
MKHFYLLLSFITLFLACKPTQKAILTRADLKPTAKIFVLDKENMPIKPAYTFSIYNDGRIELNAYSKINKTGAFTTMLNAAEYEKFEQTIKDFKAGHLSFNHSQENLGYDIVYYPLKKDASMANPKILPISEKTATITRMIDDYVAYKNWYKKDDAPKLFGDDVPNEIIVTFKQGIKPAETVKRLETEFGTTVKRQIDATTNTYIINYMKGEKAGVIQAFRRQAEVTGVIENSFLRAKENLQQFENQELIVQFKQSIDINEWIKNYATQKMQFVKQVAPDMNYYVVSYYSGTLPAKDMIEMIKKDARVVDAQTNKKVLPRE